MGSIISVFLRVSIVVDKFVMHELRILSQEDSERNRVVVELRGAILEANQCVVTYLLWNSILGFRSMTRRSPCSFCGSRQWHKEPSSGFIVCSEGHVLQVSGLGCSFGRGSLARLKDYRKETTEMEHLGPHGVRKRAVKSTRSKKDKVDLNRTWLCVYYSSMGLKRARVPRCARAVPLL
jgi:hypothetical protein